MGDAGLPGLIAQIEAQGEPEVYTEFQPWMVGRLVGVEITRSEYRGYTYHNDNHDDGYSRTIYQRAAGRLVGYSMEDGKHGPKLVARLDIGNIEKPTGQHPVSFTMEITVVEKLADPQLASQYIEDRALYRASARNEAEVQIVISKDRRAASRRARIVKRLAHG